MPRTNTGRTNPEVDTSISASPEALSRAGRQRRNTHAEVSRVEEEKPGIVSRTLKWIGRGLVVTGIGALIMGLLWRIAGRNIPIFNPAPGAAEVARAGVAPMATSTLPEHNPTPTSVVPNQFSPNPDIYVPVPPTPTYPSSPSLPGPQG